MPVNGGIVQPRSVADLLYREWICRHRPTIRTSDPPSVRELTAMTSTINEAVVAYAVDLDDILSEAFQEPIPGFVYHFSPTVGRAVFCGISAQDLATELHEDATYWLFHGHCAAQSRRWDGESSFNAHFNLWVESSWSEPEETGGVILKVRLSPKAAAREHGVSCLFQAAMDEVRHVFSDTFRYKFLREDLQERELRFLVMDEIDVDLIASFPDQLRIRGWSVGAPGSPFDDPR